MPGNAICKSTDLPDLKFPPCCDELNVQCLPWTGEGYVAGDEPDLFCQFVQPIADGGDCSVCGDLSRKTKLSIHFYSGNERIM